MNTPNNVFKLRLLQGTKQVGFWCSSASPLVTEMVASLKPDFVVIDGEHAPENSMATLIGQLRAVQAANFNSGQQVAPLVRIPINDPVLFKFILDGGANTVVVPMVNTPAEAEQAVRAMRYPPNGIRGVALSHRGNLFGHATDYTLAVNSQLCLVVQIETVEAVNNLEAIAEVNGVDCLFFGPSDAAASIGHLGDINHSAVTDLTATVLARAKAIGKPIGILWPNKERAKELLHMGFDWVAVGSDLGAMVGAIKSTLAHFRG